MVHFSKKIIFTKVNHSFSVVKLYSILFFVLSFQLVTAQSWYNLNWLYRRSVAVSNPGTIALYNFQVQIKLDNTFDFTKSQSGGSDIRVTANDGTTLIPFWIETWDAVGHQAVIWVKLTTIPTSGTSVYIYYGNSANPIPSPAVFEVPPTGPFTRVGQVVPAGGEGKSFLAENIVFDPVTNHYWMCQANYTDKAISLCWSNTPADPTSWTWSGNVIQNNDFFSISPHLILENGIWYLFYSEVPNIKVATSSSVSGPYTINATPALVRSGLAWDAFRVDEPYVFKRASDNKWVMVYMGDAGSYVEQNGYATADNITGPYTAYSGNPCIPFGPAGSYDAGTIADPWVYYLNGVYYIGYATSATNEPPWQTAVCTTTDWLTFTKLGLISPSLSSGWDYPNAFRGAVIRVGDTYLLSYTGAGQGSGTGIYGMGLATQPVYFDPSTIINNGDAVFDFFDGFSGNSLDLAKWSIQGPSNQAGIENGLLTLEGTGTHIKLYSKNKFGSGFMAETRAQHPNQKVLNMIVELGFTDDYWNTVRIVDDFTGTLKWQKQARKESGDDNNITNMAQNADQNWHIFHVGRHIENVAAFQIDDNNFENIQDANVPTIDLPTFLMSFGLGNQLVTDWTRVRKWVGSDPVTLVGIEQAESGVNCLWSGSTSTDWSTPGNWTESIVPQSFSFVTIPASASYKPHVTSSPSSPTECKNLTIDASSMLTIDAGKALTIYGTLVNNAGSAGLVIKSDATGTGSLIQSSLNVPAKVERYISGGWSTWNSGWHLISSPVANQAISGFTTTGTGNDYDFYAWYELWNLWINYKESSFNPYNGPNFNIGQGYLISYEQNQTGKYFSGYINASNVTTSNMTLSAGANYSWHLLGNPFSSPLRWNDGNWALSNIAGTAKIWNETAQSYSDIPANEVIPSAQGFMISVNSSTNSITIPVASRIHSNTAWYKSGENQQIRLLASEDNDNSFQESIININSKARSGFDFANDSRFLPGYAPQFYSVKGDEKLSTNTFPSISGENIIHFGFVKNEAVNYKIELKENIGGRTIYLTDLKTNTDQKLNESPVYKFTSTEGDDPNRFLLHFSTLNVDESAEMEDVKIYFNNEDINIFTNQRLNAKVLVANMLGEVILRGQTNDNEQTILNAHSLKNGVYVVTLLFPHKVVSKKIVIYR